MKTRICLVSVLLASQIFFALAPTGTSMAFNGIPAHATESPTSLDEVTIAGPMTGTINTAYYFTANVLPITATTPITYVWQTAGQSLVTHPGRLVLSDTVTFTWNTVGDKAITVTATNETDIVTDSYTVTINYHSIYLPLIVRRWPPVPYTPSLSVIGNADQDNNYTIYWTEQPEQLADSYILQEATNTTFTAGLRNVCTTWQQSCDVTNQLPGTYYYRVAGYNEWGNSAWSITQLARVYPLFVGLSIRWDGNGYVRRESEYADIGYHLQQNMNGLTDADTVRAHGNAWYDPDPYGWGSDTWDSYYSISTGYFKSSTNPGNPSWKWGEPWIMPYDWQLWNGQTFVLDRQAFLVSGPFSGYTAFGKPVQYWQLVNRDRFLYWSAGGDWTVYVHPGDITLRYDAGNTRLEIYSNILRRDYYQGHLTSGTVQYIIQLTSANSFPGLTTSNVFPPQPANVTTLPSSGSHIDGAEVMKQR